MKIQYDLVIKNGTLVLPRKNNYDSSLQTPRPLHQETLTIAVKNKKIVALGSEAEKGSAQQIFDAKGLHILPGLIDTQVHFREPGFPLKEDLSSGSKAALLGGITAFFEMPNTKPPTLSAIDFSDKLQRARSRSWAHYAFYMGADLTNYKKLPELENLPHCCGIKVFLGSSTGHLVLEDQDALEFLMAHTKRRISFHSEDESRLTERHSIALEANGDVKKHYEWRDVKSAMLSTQRIVELAKKYKHFIHILHVTTADEIEYLKQHKDYVSVETTPQHLTLSAPDCYDQLGTLVQMNPPIRTEEHRLALWAGITSDTIDVLGSDHAPHTLEEKAQAYPHSPSGMTGVQTLLPLMLNHCSQKRISIERITQLLADQPHRLWKIKNKGVIAVGFDADFTIVDLKKTKTIENKWIASRCGWTPFDGMKVTGWPVATLLNGSIAMRDEEIIGSPQGEPLNFE